MDVKKAMHIAKIALEQESPFISIKKDALEVLMNSARYDPEIRYVRSEEKAVIHKLVDGTKVLLNR
jgi:hypothetical protein